MSPRRFASAVAAVFLARAVAGGLVLGLVFGSVFDSPSPAFRLEGEEIHGAHLAGMVLWALTFTYLYAKLVTEPSVGSGLWYGLVVWSFYFIPMLLGTWAYMDVSLTWTAVGLVSGLAESLTAGLVATTVLRWSPRAATANQPKPLSNTHSA